MKWNFKVGLMAFGLVLIGVLMYGIYLFQEKPSGVLHKPTEIKIAAHEIIQQYEAEESLANHKFLGKVIEVSGNLQKISLKGDTAAYLFLGQPNRMAQVRCAFGADQLKGLKKLPLATLITIKGLCIGYLMDVELDKCVLLK